MNATESQIRAEQIVRGLYGRGVDLYVEDGEIRYKSRIEGTVADLVNLLDADLVDLNENKPEIVALLLLLKKGMPFNWDACEGAGDEAG